MELNMADSSNIERLNKFLNACADGKDIGKVYNDWAENYDEDLEDHYLKNYNTIFGTIDKLFKENKDALFLEIGAGTGRGGRGLKPLGYTNVEALDPAQEMLDIAQKDNIYKKTYCQLVGPTPLPMPPNTYDCVFGIGVVAPNHIKHDAIPDILKVLKPGGYFVVQSNYQRWRTLKAYHVDMAATIEKLVQEKKWENIEWTIIKDYLDSDIGDNDGFIFVYRKL